ncbi:unnamed protein product [Bathycoccus prasinos]
MCMNYTFLIYKVNLVRQCDLCLLCNSTSRQDWQRSRDARASFAIVCGNSPIQTSVILRKSKR